MTLDQARQVLGVSPEAGPEEIRTAHRRLARRYHPDLHPDDPHAAEMMAVINQANDLLTGRCAPVQWTPQPAPGQGLISLLMDIARVIMQDPSFQKLVQDLTREAPHGL